MKMSRLIDADKLPIKFDGHKFVVVRKNDLDNAPIVDAVEVVRCKDCKLFEPNTFPIRTGHPCSRVGLEPNDFCSWVEPLWEEEVEDEDD